MQIQVYCDESGTGGFDQKGKDPIPTMYGYIAPVEYWVKEFYPDWRAVLDKKGVSYFHFRELNKNARRKPSNPYYGWSDGDVDNFLDDLSIVAGRTAIPCGSHGTLKGGEDPYKKIFELFFKDCFNRIEMHWPKFNERVDFFFESTNNKKWSKQILEVAESFRLNEKRLGTPSFPCWDDPRNGLPLQAADLLAYSQRQNAAWFFEHNRTVREYRILDFALLRNIFPKGDSRRVCTLTDEKREKLIRFFRADKNAKDIYRAFEGLPKTDYFPLRVLKEEYRDKGIKLNLGGTY